MATKKPWAELRERTLKIADPVRAADVVLHSLGCRSPAVPVEDLCRRLGVPVVRATDMNGAFGVLDARTLEPTIYVNGEHHANAQRFTIAHELGHLLLHPLKKHYRDASHVSMVVPAFTPEMAREQEANTFAAHLLMPLWMLGPEVRAARSTDVSLALKFGVSAGSMRWQLQSL